MRLSPPTFVLVVVMILLGMMALNVADQRFAPKSPEEEAAEQARQAEQKTGAPVAAASGTATLVQLPADETLGSPSAKTAVVFGWEWTPEVQANPDRMVTLIQSLRGSAEHGDIRLRIVNVDQAPDAPRGLAVNGKTVMELPPGGIPDQSQLMQALSRVPHSH